MFTILNYGFHRFPVIIYIFVSYFQRNSIRRLVVAPLRYPHPLPILIVGFNCPQVQPFHVFPASLSHFYLYLQIYLRVYLFIYVGTDVYTYFKTIIMMTYIPWFIFVCFLEQQLFFVCPLPMLSRYHECSSFSCQFSSLASIVPTLIFPRPRRRIYIYKFLYESYLFCF